MVVKRKNVAKTGQVAHADDFFQEKTKETKVKRRRFGWGSCLLAIFLIITLFVLFGLGLLASTGLVRIPIISPIVYRENPQPLRIVKPVDQSIEEIFSSAVIEDSKAKVSESQLTKLLQQPAEDGQLAFKQAQVVVEADQAEIYTLAGKNSQLVVRAKLIPVGNDLVVDSVHLGYLKLPTGLAQRLIHFISGENLSLLGLLEQYNVSSIEIEPGFVLLGVSMQIQQELVDSVDLGELTGLADLDGRTIGDLKNNLLSDAELTLLSQNLDQLPVELRVFLET